VVVYVLNRVQGDSAVRDYCCRTDHVDWNHSWETWRNLKCQDVKDSSLWDVMPCGLVNSYITQHKTTTTITTTTTTTKWTIIYYIIFQFKHWIFNSNTFRPSSVHIQFLHTNFTRIKRRFCVNKLNQNYVFMFLDGSKAVAETHNWKSASYNVVFINYMMTDVCTVEAGCVQCNCKQDPASWWLL